MAIEFKPSAPEYRLLQERDAHGRERVAIAVRNGPRNWAATLTHPDGQIWTAQINHARENEVHAYLSDFMASKTNEFVQARLRGDKPPTKIETSRAVPVGSEAPITKWR
jgi:hypothetical protein